MPSVTWRGVLGNKFAIKMLCFFQKFYEIIVFGGSIEKFSEEFHGKDVEKPPCFDRILLEESGNLPHSLTMLLLWNKMSW